MAAPDLYTEKSLGEYMARRLGKVAKALGLSSGPNDAGDFVEAVNDALLLYGTNDISTITGMDAIQKLRALALVAAWQYVVTNFVALYNFSADGASYSRSNLFDQAKEALEMAKTEALVFDPAYSIRIRKVDHIHDPYAVRDTEERSL